MKINVIDGIMGIGKTSLSITMINENPKNKYMYITPYLDECTRIKTKCKKLNFIEPNVANGRGSKGRHLKELIQEGYNIVSTHSLFKNLDAETVELLKEKEYTLFLDEVMDVVEELKIKKDDLNILKSEFVNIKDDMVLEWKEEKKDYAGEKFMQEKKMCEHGSLILVEDKVLMWKFPVEVFKQFKEIYILTYMFEYQVQKYYFDYYNLDYSFYSVDNQEGEYKLVEKGLSTYEIEKKKLVKELITLQDGKYNDIGKDDFTLSDSWMKKNVSMYPEIKNNLLNFFKYSCKTPGELNGWTTFKEYKPKLKGKGYTKGFIPINMRATNEYQDKTSLAYVANRYMKPYLVKMFKYRNITVDQDKWALSEMLQWIWRGSIRKNEPMKLYIPSARMRNIFLKWLDNEIKE